MEGSQTNNSTSSTSLYYRIMASYNASSKRVLRCGPLVFSMDANHDDDGSQFEFDEIDVTESKYSDSEERKEPTFKSPSSSSSSSMKRSSSSPGLTSLAALESQVTAKRLKQEDFTQSTPRRLPKSASTPLLTQLIADPIPMHSPSAENMIIRPSAHPMSRLPPTPDSDIRPQDFLWALLEFKGHAPKCFPSFSIPGFFLPVTPEMIDGYDMELVTAIRQQNVAQLEQIAKARPSIQSCNRFGESIVHTACRTGSVPILECLMKNGVSLRVRCEAGRTPLHDACWTSHVNFDLIRLLVKQCPDFLYITDQHGFSPLAYFEKSRPELWKPWNNFLLDNHELLLPRTLTF